MESDYHSRSSIYYIKGNNGNAGKGGMMKRWEPKKGDMVWMTLPVRKFEASGPWSPWSTGYWYYFRTKEQAEEAARRVKKVLKDYHKEIGE